MKLTRNNLFPTIVASSALLFSHARAASGTWTQTTAGPFDWSLAATGNWSGGTVADGADSTANFTANITAGQTVNLAETRTIGNITFTDSTTSSNDLTISGANTLTLDRTDATRPTINVTQSGRILTISSQISGSDGLLKSGAGTLTLSGNNNFSGGITLGAGVLRLSGTQSFTGGVTLNAGNLGDNTTPLSAASLNNNAIVVAASSSIGAAAGATFSSSTSVTINAGLLTIANNNGATTWNGAFTGAGGIALGILGAGANTLNLNSTGNTFTGGVDFTNTANQISALNVNSFADSATPGTGNIRFGISNTNAQTHTFALGSGAIAPLTIANRQFVIAGTGSIIPTISNNSSQAFTISSNMANSGTGTRTLTLGGTGSGLSLFSGDITNGSLTTLAVAKAATANQWNLSGNNTFNGGLSTGNGGTTSTLGLGSATAWGTGTFTIGTGRFDNTSGAALTMSGNNAIAWNGDTTFLGTNSLDLGTGAVTMGGNRTITVGGTLTMGGVVADGASDFNIVKGGGGTFVLSGLNSYSGRTSVNQGVLSINTIRNVGAGDSSLGNPTTVANGTINLGSATLGATLLYTGTGTTTTDRVVNLSGTTGGATLNMSGTGTLTFTSPFTATGAGIKTLTLTGSSAGAGVIEGAIVNSASNTALAKTGTGTWTLSGPNTYSGGTTIGNNTQNVGTLNITHGSALGTGAVSIVSNFSSGNFATLTLNSASGITVPNNFTTSGEGHGSNGIIRNVTGNNVISGNFTLGGGGGSTRIHSDGGSLTLSGNIAPNTTARFLFLGGSAAGTISGNINDGSGANTLSGVTKQGAGTWTLSGTNTYTGPTTVSAGTMLVNGSNPAAGLVTVSATATLGGSGSAGAVTVQNGGTLAPGNSIESLGVASVDFAANSTFAYEFQTDLFAGSPNASADLVHSSGAFGLASGAILTLTDLGPGTALSPGSKFTLVSYTGGTPAGVFTHGGSPLLDGDIKTIGANTWQFNYADTSGGVNFASDQTGATQYFTMTVVPEAGTAGLLALGLLLVRRLRQR